MLYQIDSTRPLQELEQRLQESAARHQFGVLAIHDLRETMKKKGLDLAMECRIYEVCNPFQAKKALEADPAISTALPCRISIYGSGDRYTLATIRPTELMKGFSNPGIAAVAREVEAVMIEMIEETAGK